RHAATSALFDPKLDEGARHRFQRLVLLVAAEPTERHVMWWPLFDGPDTERAVLGVRDRADVSDGFYEVIGDGAFVDPPAWPGDEVVHSPCVSLDGDVAFDAVGGVAGPR